MKFKGHQFCQSIQHTLPNRC